MLSSGVAAMKHKDLAESVSGFLTLMALTWLLNSLLLCSKLTLSWDPRAVSGIVNRRCGGPESSGGTDGRSCQ